MKLFKVLFICISLLFVSACSQMSLDNPFSTPTTVKMSQASLDRILNGVATPNDLDILISKYQEGANEIVSDGLIVPPLNGQFSVFLFQNEMQDPSALYMTVAGSSAILIADTRNGPVSVQTVPTYAALSPVRFFLVTTTAAGLVTNQGGIRVSFNENGLRWQIVFGDGDANAGHGNDADGLDEDNPTVGGTSTSVPVTVINVHLIPSSAQIDNGIRIDQGEGTAGRTDPDAGGTPTVPVVAASDPVSPEITGTIETSDTTIQISDISTMLSVYINYLDAEYYMTDPFGRGLLCPAYSCGVPWRYEVNIGVSASDPLFATSQFMVYAIHETLQSAPLAGQNPPQSWENISLAYGQTTTLTATYAMPIGTPCGWYQTHVIIIRRSGVDDVQMTVFDNPQVGIIDP